MFDGNALPFYLDAAEARRLADLAGAERSRTFATIRRLRRRRRRSRWDGVGLDVDLDALRADARRLADLSTTLRHHAGAVERGRS